MPAESPWRALASITGVGARTPAGQNSLEVAMGARAGRFEPRDCRFLDRFGHAVGVVRCRALADDLHGADRLVALAAPALAEACAGLREPVPLVVALPEASRPDQAGLDPEALIAGMAARASVAFDRSRGAALRTGNAGFAAALSTALGLLSRGARVVVVGGVDSFYHPAAIAWLDETRRLHSFSYEGGTIPGEGAAFLRLEGPRAEGVAALLHAETADETEEMALVSTRLVRRAIGPIGATPIRWVACDRTSERSRAREWSLVRQRLLEEIPREARQDVIPRLFGSLGAATGAVFAAHAARLWDTGCAPAAAVAVALASEGAARGAFALGWTGRLSPDRASVALPQPRAVEIAPPAAPDDPVADETLRLARDAAEEVSIHSVLRLANDDEGWWDVQPFEQRLFANLDAFMALARIGRIDLVAPLLRYADEMNGRDPGRAFASTLILACAGREDAVATAVRRLAEGSPDTATARGEALALSPSAAVRPALERLLGEDAPAEAIAAAISALAFRREVSFALLVPLVHHHAPCVALAAVRAMALIEPTGPAIGVLEAFVDERPAPELSLAAADSLLRVHAPSGLATARRLLQEALDGAHAPPVLERAAWLVALSGDASDSSSLERAAEAHAPLVEALGWHGDAASIEHLLGFLDALNHVRRGSPELHAAAERAAAAALERLLGRGLIDGDEAAGEPGLGTNAELWRDAWMERRATMPVGPRYRFGRAHSSLVSWDELSAEQTRRRARARCALEVALHARARSLPELDDWTARQRARLSALREELGEGTPAGVWPPTWPRGSGAAAR